MCIFETTSKNDAIELFKLKSTELIWFLFILAVQNELFGDWRANAVLLGFYAASTLFQLYHGDSSLIRDPWVNKPVLG